LQDVTVPTINPDIKIDIRIDCGIDNTVGIDMGVKDFLITSDAETVPIPQFARKAESEKNCEIGLFLVKRKVVTADEKLIFDMLVCIWI
jgi:hypothetical protein